MVLFPKLPENSSIEYTFGSSDHSESPQITSVYAGFSGFAGTTTEQSIEGRIRNRLVSDPCVPVFDWQLTGHDGCSCAATVIDDFEQIAT